MTAGPVATGPESVDPAPETGRFRPDIQGLRAIAVGLVVVFHLWPSGLRGGYVGVDVFFVISGFLMTDHLVRSRPRRVGDLTHFWARRIRRLLPAAVLVLAVTLVATRLVAPETRWMDTAREAIASALFVQNWHLAGSAVDYLNADAAPGPLQHFWSLSVEEQFYLFWPLLIAAVFLASRRWRVGAMPLLLVAMVAVVAVSLAASVSWTAGEPQAAYFATFTRVWELALGGVVALAAPTAGALGEPVRGALAWTGLVAILLSAALFTEATPFPGVAALLPTLGTALVVWAASARRPGPSVLLGVRPVHWVGDRSYSLYLWHWPLVVLVPYLAPGLDGVAFGLVVLGSSMGLAAWTTAYVENRFRVPGAHGRILSSYRLAVVGLVGVIALGMAQRIEVEVRDSAALEQLAIRTAGAERCLGAAAVAHGPEVCPPDSSATLLPTPRLARNDTPDAYRDRCWSNAPYTGRSTCTYGDGPTQVALVGNSHAGHWLPALQRIAQEQDWTITTFLVARCNPTTLRLAFETDEKTTGCHDYGQWVLDRTTGGDFDLVITSQRQAVRAAGSDWAGTMVRAETAYREYLNRWAQAGSSVLVIRDTPHPGATGVSVPDCLAQHTDALDCSGSPEEWVPHDPLYEAARGLEDPRVHTVDMTDFFCFDHTCHTAIGSVVAYSDDQHVTATYARTLAGFLMERIEDTSLADGTDRDDARSGPDGRAAGAA